MTVKAKVDAAWTFAPNQRIEVFNSAGARVFVGWARNPKPSLDVQERVTWEFEDPTRWLDSTFEQAGNFRESAAYVQHLQSEVTLFRSHDLALGLPVPGSVTVAAQNESILLYAQTFGNAGGAAPFDYDITGVPTDVIPMARKSSATCMDCLTTAEEKIPGLSCHWKYAGAVGTNPKLVFVNLETINMTTGALLDPPTLAGADAPIIHTFPNDGTMMLKCAPEPMDRELYGTVKIHWIATETETMPPLSLGGPQAERPIRALHLHQYGRERLAAHAVTQHPAAPTAVEWDREGNRRGGAVHQPRAPDSHDVRVCVLEFPTRESFCGRGFDVRFSVGQTPWRPLEPHELRQRARRSERSDPRHLA